ncbi:MAG: hypothetical protein U0074_00075 [Kouleothrix sp.]
MARATAEVVVCADGVTLDHIGEQAKQYQLTNVDLVKGTPASRSGECRVARLLTPMRLANFGSDAAAVAELQRLLAPDGVVYVEQPGLIAGKRDQAAIRRLVAAVGTPQRFLADAYERRDAILTIATGDQATTNYFLRYSLTSRAGEFFDTETGGTCAAPKAAWAKECCTNASGLWPGHAVG